MALAMASVGVAAQQSAEQPRFRGGANLVRVDAYISKDGTPVTDLTANDVEVFEDDKPQKIEAFELITRRPSSGQPPRSEPTTVAGMREAAADSSARLFTLFFDTNHVSLSGSYGAKNAIVESLDKIIGQDDLVGAMTSEMSPANITYAHRTTSIEHFVTETWHWGQRDRMPTEPADQDLYLCYPDGGETTGIAARMIARRREQRTLDALSGLVTHLDGLRPERKFVIVFTEGWPLYQRDESLARVIGGAPPGPDRIGLGPGGRLTTGATQQDQSSLTKEACDRQRLMLAYIDHQVELREILQRANRSNVSFYPVDARGLVVFDTPIGGPGINQPLPPSVDDARLRQRYDGLRMMADQTDGVAILSSTNAVGAALQRVFADVGSYYLMSYYSTNTKLDGRFRRIGVRVKREGLDVRSRPGYLAPTESEARASGVVLPDKTGRLTPPPTVTRALDALAPTRGNLPVRIQASGGAGMVRAIVELDPATMKLPEWSGGGDLKLSIEGERGSNPYTINIVIEPGQRSITTVVPGSTLPPGRYSVKAELTARGSRLPLQVTTFAVVPAETATMGTAALALRRGPSTGLAYLPTADSRFRRTERIRLEVPLLADGVTTTGRMLNREGQVMPLTVTTGERADGAMKLATAEVILAPLAEGEYVIELSCAAKTGTETISYGFRIVP